MELRERIFTQILCNLIQILQGSLAQSSELKPEDLNLSEVETNPVMNFEMGPFESLDDGFYRLNQHLGAVELASKRIRELPTQADRAKPEKLQGWKQRRPGEGRRRCENKLQKKKPHSDGDQVGTMTTRTPNRPEASRSLDAEINGLREEVKAIKKQMSELKKLSNLIGSVKEKVDELGSAISAESLEKILRVVEGNQWRGRPEDERGKDENKMINGNGDEARLKEMNNISYNNQYLIDAIFIINRLSEERENFDSNFNEYKGTDVEILKELTGGKMKELFEKKLNNLNADSISKATEGDFPKVTHPELLESEVDLVEQLQENFSRIFLRHNVTLEQMNQMAKIVDFVERYHGVVSDSENFDFARPEYVEKTGEAEAGPEAQPDRRNRKVLDDRRWDLAQVEYSEENHGVKKKGSIT